MTRTPALPSDAANIAATRRLARLGVAAGVAFAALVFGLGDAPSAAGDGGATATVTVTVTDAAAPPNPRAPTWGRITSRPAGIDCPGRCTASFARGSAVVLTAVAKKGYELGGWDRSKDGGPGCRNAPTCSLTIDGDERVSASLLPTGALIVNTVGAGGLVVEPAEAGRHDRVCGARWIQAGSQACWQRYPDGTNVTLRAVVDPTVRGARFLGWSDYRCAPRRLTCTLPMRGEHNLTARFDPIYLTVVEGTFGAVGFTPAPRSPCAFAVDPREYEGRACTVTYPLNTIVTLRHGPRADDASFWQDACGGSGGSTCSVRMDADQRVVAGTHTGSAGGGVGEVIWLEYGGPRGGRVSIRPIEGGQVAKRCRRTCSVGGFGHGELVEIRAEAGPGVRFRGWADSNVRSSVRRLRIGTRNPVKAIFARR
jgi:hypothetical protein